MTGENTVELRTKILEVKATWTDGEKKYVKPSLDYLLEDSCVEKGKPSGATRQKSGTLPAATAPTQLMFNAAKTRLDATLGVRAKKKASLQKVIYASRKHNGCNAYRTDGECTNRSNTINNECTGIDIGSRGYALCQ